MEDKSKITHDEVLIARRVFREINPLVDRTFVHRQDPADMLDLPNFVYGDNCVEERPGEYGYPSFDKIYMYIRGMSDEQRAEFQVRLHELPHNSFIVDKDGISCIGWIAS